ncbi:MAG: hypothetical protein WA902_07275, partial [Thermosynechococcaceae cyanobacterium]
VAAASDAASPTPLMAHIFNQTHDSVGYTSAEGVFIGHYPVKKGDATNAQSAQLILQDPTVDIAVLDTSHRSILQSGLAFEHCDVGVVLTIEAEHSSSLCASGHGARTMSVIAGAVHAGGYAVLNADDERVVTMAEQVLGKVAYVSLDLENAVVRSHLQQGGIAAVYDHGYLAIVQQDKVQRIENVANLPMLRDSVSTIAALAACLTTYIQGVTIAQIKAALLTYPSSEQPPQPTGGFNFNDYNLPGLIKPYRDSQQPAPRAEPLSPLEPQRMAANQLREAPPLNGFCFWGTLSTAVPDLEVTATEGAGPSNLIAENEPQLETREPVAAVEERFKPQSYLETDLRSVGPNDPTTLWIEFENRLKPQNVLQDRISKAKTVAFMATDPEPSDASVTSQTAQSKGGVSTQIEALRSKVAAVEETVESARKEIAALSAAMEQHEVNAWVVYQLDRMRRWTKKQAPVAISVAQQVTEQALDKGGTVVAIAVVLIRSAAQLTFELGRDVGAIYRGKAVSNDSPNAKVS